MQRVVVGSAIVLNEECPRSIRSILIMIYFTLRIPCLGAQIQGGETFCGKIEREQVC